MSRINLEHTVSDIIRIMSDGNPGAMGALVSLVKDGPDIDPQGAMGGVGYILNLDSLGIYGTGIHVLWNDKCGRDVRRFCLLLRGWQLGLLKTETIKSMAADQRYEVNLTDEEWEDLDGSVCRRVEGFSRKVPTECEEGK